MGCKKKNFIKDKKLRCKTITIMLIITTFLSINVGSTLVTNNGTPSDYVKASQTYILVMNFTITTESDLLLAGVWPADGTLLEATNQSDDWGSELGTDMWFYDAVEDLGPWNASEDCIFLDNIIDDDRYNSGETLLVGTAPTSGTNGTGRGCKNPTAWNLIKAYDAVNGSSWDGLNDSIVLEGMDNNSAFHEELNAVTLNMSGSCNATNADIDDLTLWLESSGPGFDSNADTILGNATFSTNSFSWNITGLSQDINTSATFYVTVNTSAGSTHWNEIIMEIPTLSDSGTIGSYDNDDKGLFLAGSNDTGGITNSNTQTIDTNAPTTSVDAIDPYWSVTGSISITASASDIPSGVANVTLCYRYCNDNATWGGWIADATDISSPYSWIFTCPNGSGYYEFYSRGVDNAGNNESASASNDTLSAYDDSNPDSTITAPVDGSELNSLTNISGTASDTFSGVASVSITIYNITDGTYFNGTNWQTASYSLTANGTTAWYYEDTTAFPTWASGSNYIINSTDTDAAGNIEAAADSNTFNYDIDGPTTTIIVPANTTWYNALTNIIGTAGDTGGSGISSVNLTIFNSTGAKYWNGSDWQMTNIVWMNTNGTTVWFNDSNLPIWSNGSTYLVNATATDQAGNVGTTSWNTFYFDDNGIESSVTAINPYWQATQPLSISYTAEDFGSGLSTVALKYRYSSDNSSWGSWVTYSTDSNPWIDTTFSFDFNNGSGFYEFYTIATDNASNSESAPVSYDTIIGYDPDAPTTSIDSIDPYWDTSTEVTLTATTSDSVSGVASVVFYYYNSTDNSTWTGPYSVGTDTTDPYSVTFNFSTNGSTYYRFFSVGTDNASNTESTLVTNDTMCGADRFLPLSSVDAIVPYWNNTGTIVLTATASDNRSGIASVNFYYYNSIDNITFIGPYLANMDTSSPYSYYFVFSSFNNTGYYRFYCTSFDNAGNSESAPTTNDTECYFYNTPPNTPTTPTGDSSLTIGASGDFTTNTSEADGDQVSYRFDWGDGTYSDWSTFVDSDNTSSDSKSWSSTGTYLVKSQAKDEHGAISNWSSALSVSVISPGGGGGGDGDSYNEAPVANAGGPYSGYAEILLSFNGATSSDPDGDDLTYIWDFGDGETGLGVTPSHTYEKAGTYTVELIVSDGLLHDTNTTTAIIGEIPAQLSPPVANASGPYMGLSNNSISINGSKSYDTDGTIQKYVWNFGDGEIAYGKIVYHTYNNSGLFTLTLTVTDNDGLIDSNITTAYISQDSDGDGWSDEIEESYETDPIDSEDQIEDSDGDGIPDNPSSDGKYPGDQDDDNDKVNDDIERKIGSSPTNSNDAKKLLTPDGNTYYLADTNGDEKHDVFYDSTGKKQLKIELRSDGKYNLDVNSDGKWDYIYDSANQSVTIYKTDEKDFGIPALLIIIIIITIIILIIAGLFKTGYLYIEEVDE